mmetsp:Transcript_8914/g.18891  ORF Transcript_8914/g.18891 Transcript_8914/m.18891 type:complete len:153 (-) Transcript_8914:100-558(-)
MLSPGFDTAVIVGASVLLSFVAWEILLKDLPARRSLEKAGTAAEFYKNRPSAYKALPLACLAVFVGGIGYFSVSVRTAPASSGIIFFLCFFTVFTNTKFIIGPSAKLRNIGDGELDDNGKPAIDVNLESILIGHIIASTNLIIILVSVTLKF